MLSRIADSLFWLNRYMERSDCLLRVIRTNYILSFDAGNSSSFSWKDVIQNFSTTPGDIADLDNVDAASALNLLVADLKNANSVKVLLTKARENAQPDFGKADAGFVVVDRRRNDSREGV